MSHKIAYREYGSGPLLLLLHGFGGSVLHWNGVIDSLKTRFRVIVPNLSHLYLSKNRLLYSVQIETVANFIQEHFPGQKVHLAGMSFGGGLCWGLSLQHPSLVDQMVLLNPLVPAPVGKFKLPEMRYFFVLPMGAKEMAKLLRSPIGGSFLKSVAVVFRPDRDLAERKVARMSEVKLAFIADLVAHFSWILRNEDWNYWQINLTRIQAPTLVVASKDDNLFVDSICQEFSRHIRGARYVEVETGGHLLATSQPEFVAQQILDFLKPKEDQKAS